MNELTRILEAIEKGEPHAQDQLLPLVYQELRRLAGQMMLQERPGQTLQATALVHEAYLRIIGPSDGPAWNGRGHFFAAAAEAMRRILVEAARRKGRIKRGGDLRRVDLDELPAAPEDAPADDLIALDAALGALAEFDPVKAQVVKLRYFAGLTIEQTADCLNLSPATVKRSWAVARAWLFRHLSTDNPCATDRDS